MKNDEHTIVVVPLVQRVAEGRGGTKEKRMVVYVFGFLGLKIEPKKAFFTLMGI